MGYVGTECLSAIILLMEWVKVYFLSFFFFEAGIIYPLTNTEYIM